MLLWDAHASAGHVFLVSCTRARLFGPDLVVNGALLGRICFSSALMQVASGLGPFEEGGFPPIGLVCESHRRLGIRERAQVCAWDRAQDVWKLEETPAKAI